MKNTYNEVITLHSLINEEQSQFVIGGDDLKIEENREEESKSKIKITIPACRLRLENLMESQEKRKQEDIKLVKEEQHLQSTVGSKVSHDLVMDKDITNEDKDDKENKILEGVAIQKKIVSKNIAAEVDLLKELIEGGNNVESTNTIGGPQND